MKKVLLRVKNQFRILATVQPGIDGVSGVEVRLPHLTPAITAMFAPPFRTYRFRSLESNVNKIRHLPLIFLLLESFA